MHMVELFLREHAILHGLDIGASEGKFSLEYGRLRGLTDEQLRLRPDGWNSIAWIFWHVTRCEDVAANVMVGERTQVFDDGERGSRLNVRRRDIGTGMSDDEVEALSRAIDIPALRAYRAAVGGRTRDVAAELPPGEWDRIVGEGLVQRAVEQGAFAPEAMWLGEFWAGKSKGWFLYWLCAGHTYMHLGQAGWVKEMILGTRGR